MSSLLLPRRPRTRRRPSVVDTFTAPNGTNITAHPTDSRHLWALDPGSGTWQITGNKLTPTSGAAIAFVESGFADFVETVTVVQTVSQPLAQCFRFIDSSAYLYVYGYDNGAGAGANWSIRRTLSGADTQLAAGASRPNAGTSYVLRLEAIKSALRLYVNGALMVSATDASVLAAATKHGLRLSGGANGTATADDFSIEAA